MKKMKEKQMSKSTVPLKTSHNDTRADLSNYIGDYSNKNKQKSKGKNYEKVSFKYSNLQIIKQMTKSRNQYFSPHSSIDFKKSHNEPKPNRTQFVMNKDKDACKINVVRSKVYNNTSFIDINESKNNNAVANSIKENRTVTTKQSTVSNSKPKEIRAQTSKLITLNKKKLTDLSFNNDISFTKMSSYKIYNSNDVSMSQLTNAGAKNSNRKNKFIYRKKPMHLSSSIDLSTRRNISFLNPLLNESLATSCLSKNNVHPYNKEDIHASLNADGIEDLHFKLVEIYQKKKYIYVNIAGHLGEEGEEINNNYLEKEKGK